MPEHTHNKGKMWQQQKAVLLIQSIFPCVVHLLIHAKD